jgi:predicted amidophosphoribosyltransferase
VPVSAAACPACGLALYPPESSAEADECRCAACGQGMAIDDTVCPHCGAAVTVVAAPADEFYCSECGGDVAEDATVCPHCGAELEEDDEAADEEDGYVCSTCGGEVDVDATVCPHCGADVAEIEEAPAEPGAPALTVRQMAFLQEAERLPEPCLRALKPAEDDKLVLPALEPKVGDIVIRFIFSEVVVSVGAHTEGRFASLSEAVDFIGDVVRDRIIFYFMDEGEVDVYRTEELPDSEPIGWSYYVWSGPLRNRRTGIDWARPPER